MSLPEFKHEKYTTRLSAYLNAGKVSLDETMKLQGTLQHMTFICTAGSSYLPSLAQAIKEFKEDRNHCLPLSCDMGGVIGPGMVAVDLVEAGHFMVLAPMLHIDPDVWVNASTSWGIGIMVKGCWAAWKLLDGWRSRDCDISWVEMIAMELALLWVLAAGICDMKVMIQGENMGVLGTLNTGRSRNTASNLSIFWMALDMAPANILVEPVYMTLETNLADACSCSSGCQEWVFRSD